MFNRLRRNILVYQKYLIFFLLLIYENYLLINNIICVKIAIN